MAPLGHSSLVLHSETHKGCQRHVTGSHSLIRGPNNLIHPVGHGSHSLGQRVLFNASSCSDAECKFPFGFRSKRAELLRIEKEKPSSSKR